MFSALSLIRDILLPILFALGGVILLIMGLAGDFRPLLREGLRGAARPAAGIAGAALVILACVLYLLAAQPKPPPEAAAQIPPSPANPLSTPTAAPLSPTPPTSPIPPTVSSGPATAEVSTPAGAGIMVDERGHTLALVAPGGFTMGSDQDYENERPARQVTLTHAYWIDVYEVANRQYQACVDTGICKPPHAANSETAPRYYGDSQFDYYPVVNVDWAMADQFCRAWRGGHLPTEAEWEFAARGPRSSVYPWGSASPTCDLANFAASGPCAGDTKPVASYPGGISASGLINMAGNVWEWVADWYAAPNPSQLENPLGPSGGVERILKGGSWLSKDADIRAAVRLNKPPEYFDRSVGFRCARDS